jgi:hypothetical protein
LSLADGFTIRASNTVESGVPTRPLADPLNCEAEARLLGLWIDAHRERYGVAPTLERDAFGLCLRFPPLASHNHEDGIGRIDSFGAHEANYAHFRAIGFRWDDDGFFDGAPAAHGLAARLSALGHALGPRLRYYQPKRAAMSKRTWLEGCLQGEVPLAISSDRFYGAVRLAARARLPVPSNLRRGLDYHFLGIRHDLTHHLALTHLLPRALLLELGRVLAGGLRFWQHGPLVAAPIVRFYENDLLSYCQAIWHDLPCPLDFVPTATHAENITQLWQAVERRLAEAAGDPRDWLRSDADTYTRFAIVRSPLHDHGIGGTS